MRAIAATRTPVVTAVGHETDTTLVDHVADVRAATPTDAAHRIVPEIGEQRRLVDGPARPRPRTCSPAGSSSRSAGWSRCAPGRCWPPPTACCTAARTTSLALRTRARRTRRPPRRGRRARPRARPRPRGRPLPRRHAGAGLRRRPAGRRRRWSATPPRSADGERLRVRVAGGRLPVRVDRTPTRTDRRTVSEQTRAAPSRRPPTSRRARSSPTSSAGWRPAG